MDNNMNSGKEYSSFLKRGEDPADDAQKITRTRKVRSSIMTRVIRSENPSTSAERDSKRVLGYSTRQSRTRHTSEDESQKGAEMSRDFKEMSVPMHINDDFPDDENQPPYQDATELKRAQSEGDLLNGELKLSKLRTVRSVPLLERKVHFSSTEDDGGHTQRLRRRTEEEETSEGKRHSRSYDELSWKKPHIDVRRKVELLPQKETAKRSRSADYHGPRKGILKTKRITQTSTIRISGSIPTDNGMEHETTREEQTMPGREEKRTSTTEAEPMDYSTSSTTTSTRRPESQEKLFKLPKRYRVQQDINLEPEMKPKSMIFTRKWKSEPTLAFEKTQQRSRSMERLPSEKETKLSNVKIDLIKPIDLKPLKPAYSVGDLPFATAIRNEVKFHLKPQRWKSNPELASREKLTQQEMEDVHARKPIKEFETKIVRALPVHLQPLHQPTPAKESPVKATKVKDASMQFTSVQETKSEGTQAFFEPSPTKVSVKHVYKGTQTAGEKLTVPEPVVVEFQQSTARKESPKVRRLKMVETSHDMKEPCIGEFDLSRIETIKEKEPSKKQETERLVVQYMPELEKPRREEPATVTTETCEEHTTEVKMRKRSSESKKARRDIHIGRIDDLDMELATREVK